MEGRRLASQAKLQVHRHTGIVTLARLIILVIPASHSVLRDACSRQDSSFFFVQSNSDAYSEHDFSLAKCASGDHPVGTGFSSDPFPRNSGRACWPLRIWKAPISNFFNEFGDAWSRVQSGH
jgi:hypothetical protein